MVSRSTTSTSENPDKARFFSSSHLEDTRVAEGGKISIHAERNKDLPDASGTDDENTRTSNGI